MVLCFVLGAAAALVKSDLKFPEAMGQFLSGYLMLAIGLKGGAKLSAAGLSAIWLPVAAAIGLSILAAAAAYLVLRKVGRLQRKDAGAVAAHYGSVSAVTFSAASVFLDARGVSFESFMPAVLAVMEIPGILIAIALAKRGAVNSGTFHELLTGKAPLLLLGGMVISFVAGPEGFAQVAPFFDAPFKGVLCFFLLELGLICGRRIGDVKTAGVFLASFGVLFPVLMGVIGAAGGAAAGLSTGGAALLGTLSASASYIAAPAAVRQAIPEASPAYYLTASLVITFPFNVLFGIPLYLAAARALAAP